MDENKKLTLRAVYDDGDIIFTDPVSVGGCWQVEVTFIKEQDIDIPLEANTHRPERGALGERLEKMHHDIEGELRTSPYDR